MGKIKLQKIVGNLLDKRQKVLHERNDHLEIFSRSQVIQNSRQYLLLRTNILQKTLVGCPWINSVFCDSAKCGSQIVDFIQASLFRPGFELSQTVDFKKGVTFCNNSICLCPANQSTKVTDTFVEKLVILQPFHSQPSSVILKKNTNNTNSELTRFRLKRSVYER